MSIRHSLRKISKKKIFKNSAIDFLSEAPDTMPLHCIKYSIYSLYVIMNCYLLTGLEVGSRLFSKMSFLFHLKKLWWKIWIAKFKCRCFSNPNDYGSSSLRAREVRFLLNLDETADLGEHQAFLNLNDVDYKSNRRLFKTDYHHNNR